MTARHINSKLRIKNQELSKSYFEHSTCHPERLAKDPIVFQSVQNNITILALGSEFDTRLALYIDNKIYFSKNTAEIAENPQDLEKFIMDFLPAIPNIIITDLHPLYNSTQIGKKLAKKFGAQYFQIQHHLAHIFTTFGDYITNHKLQITNYEKIVGIACDGTGYGIDEKIWGGEVFYEGKRIGHLEKQILIGGDLSIQEPARMLISILAKIYPKKDIFPFIKNYYSQKDFEVIYSQLSQNFNCQTTTSAGRVLDAISLLLGFCDNKRKYKHYATKMLEENSLPTKKRLSPKIRQENNLSILETTPLLQYIINNLQTNKKELATLAQKYIIDGLHQIAKQHHTSKNHFPIFLSGGLADNKIFRNFATKNNIYIPKNISPGDDGIAAGQIFWYLLNKKITQVLFIVQTINKN